MKRYIKKSETGGVRTIDRIKNYTDWSVIITFKDAHKIVRNCVLIERDSLEEFKLSVGDCVIVGENTITKVPTNYKPEEFIGFKVSASEFCGGHAILTTENSGPLFVIPHTRRSYTDFYYLIDSRGSPQVVSPLDLEKKYEEVKS